MRPALCHLLPNQLKYGPYPHRLAPLRATGQGAHIPSHQVEVHPGNFRTSKLLQKQGGGNRSAIGVVGDVREIGYGAIQHGSVGLMQGQLPQWVIYRQAAGQQGVGLLWLIAKAGR